MKYRLLEKTDEFGNNNYEIQKNLGMDQAPVWAYVLCHPDLGQVRKKFAEIKQSKTTVLETIDVGNEPDQ